MTPAPGQIWSHRFSDRRVRVMRVWQGGSVGLSTVEKIGPTWRRKRLSRSSICRPDVFASEFRFLEVAP